MMLDRILRGDHQKRLWQGVRVRVHRHLVLVHRFQKSGLSLRCCAIDFVG